MGNANKIRGKTDQTETRQLGKPQPQAGKRDSRAGLGRLILHYMFLFSEKEKQKQSRLVCGISNGGSLALGNFNRVSFRFNHRDHYFPLYVDETSSVEMKAESRGR